MPSIMHHANGEIWFEQIPDVSFEFSDAGRSTSLRPKQKNDCTVRALGIACGLSYDYAYSLLKKAGRDCSRGFSLKEFLLKKGIPGFRFEWHHFPAVKGTRRTYPGDFLEQHPEGYWIVRTAQHVSAVVDGVWMDDLRPRPFSCVYGAIKVIRPWKGRQRG